MAKMLKVAAIQICSGLVPRGNLLVLDGLVAQAAKAGAEYILTPEISISCASNKVDNAKYIKPFENNEDIAACAELAKKNKVFLHIGSMAIATKNGKYLNRSILFSPSGEIVAFYDKIHLFDASPPNDKPYKESDTYQAGEKAIVAKLDIGNIGFSICYDLRFPHFYNHLCEMGAQILAIPAAFTIPTGEAHWEVLLRARAIETGSFVIAAAQGGRHENGRSTYGHSMIINPWGEIAAIMNNDEIGFIIADIDINEVEKTRKIIPNLKNRAFFV